MGRSQRHLRDIHGIDSTGDNSGSTNDPVNTAVPTIAGTKQEGQTLTGTNGAFTGHGAIVVARQWLRGVTPIAGATAATYVLQLADVGQTIKFRNTATSQFGSAVADSVATTAVIAA